MENKLLEIKDLSIGFGHNPSEQLAVKNISIDLNKGETLGIVGESGSGKSLTCLSAIGLLPKAATLTSGTLNFWSKMGQVSLERISEKLWRKYRGKEIAMIFQEPMSSLNPVMKCGHQVVEMIKIHFKVSNTEAKKRAIELLEEVKIKNPERIFNSYPHQISGGQKQRVMIAIAMACKPSLLIADEPTTALDVTIQKSILELMKDLQEKHGIGIVFVSHDLAVVAEIADKVAVMYDGDLVEYGATKEIFHHPKHAYTKGLLACRPPLAKRVEKLLTIDDYLEASKKNQEPQQKIISEEQRKKSHQHIFYQGEPPLLKVKDLCTTYVSKKGLIKRTTEITKAVNEISFEVFKGETLGLVGESGCGKSTLGKTILGLIEPTSGEIYYKNELTTKLNRKQKKDFKKNAQIIFQDPFASLNPKLSVGEALTEPMRVHRLHKNEAERKMEAQRLLDRVGLTADSYYRYPHEFSGGQRQRICIARTLAVKPEFVICDESVSALDVSVQAQVLNLLNELKTEFQLTYIFISHDLSVVKYMSDRMIVMNQGKIEEMGEADAVYSKPITPYTRELIQAIPKGL